MNSSDMFPSYVKKYFWGDDISQLNWSTHKSYIVQTLLEHGDKKTIRWLLTHVSKQEITSLLPSLKLAEKSKHFWAIVLA